MAVLYYAITQMALDAAEEFGIIENNDTENSTETFCGGPGCRRYRRYHRRYYDSYWFDPWNYAWGWGNPWGYLPCVDSVNGRTYCW